MQVLPGHPLAHPKRRNSVHLLTHRLVFLCVDVHCFVFWDVPGDVLAAPASIETIETIENRSLRCPGGGVHRPIGASASPRLQPRWAAFGRARHLIAHLSRALCGSHVATVRAPKPAGTWSFRWARPRCGAGEVWLPGGVVCRGAHPAAAAASSSDRGNWEQHCQGGKRSDCSELARCCFASFTQPAGLTSCTLQGAKSEKGCSYAGAGVSPPACRQAEGVWGAAAPDESAGQHVG